MKDALYKNVFKFLVKYLVSREDRTLLSL